MKFGENLYQMRRRVKAEGPRKPLRTATEMAAEFGMSVARLCAIMAKNGGPRKVFRVTGKARNTWFEPTEVREFMARWVARETDHCPSCGLDKPLADFYQIDQYTIKTPCKVCAIAASKRSKEAKRCANVK